MSSPSTFNLTFKLPLIKRFTSPFRDRLKLYFMNLDKGKLLVKGINVNAVKIATSQKKKFNKKSYQPYSWFLGKKRTETFICRFGTQLFLIKVCSTKCIFSVKYLVSYIQK